jgi:hypothetical protein
LKTQVVCEFFCKFVKKKFWQAIWVILAQRGLVLLVHRLHGLRTKGPTQIMKKGDAVIASDSEAIVPACGWLTEFATNLRFA